MSSMACLRVGVLLERRAAGLDEAERLIVEEHVASCASCAQDARLLTLVTDLSMMADAPLSEAARSRAIDRALAAEPERLVPQVTRGRRAAGIATLAVAAAALLVGLAWLRPMTAPTVAHARFGNSARALARAAQAAALPAPRVLGGSGFAGRVALANGDVVPVGARVTTRDGLRLWIDHAVADLGAEGELSWNAAAHTVELHGGTVTVDVDPTPGRAFRVVTDSFAVEVLGTRFEVGPNFVRVERGRVRVRATDGKELAEIAAGGRWEPWGDDPTFAPASGAAPDELLRKARRELASGDADSAVRTLRGLDSLTLTRAERAEAQSLRAECALVTGNDAEAARRYESVAKEHEGTAAGENALFGAAQAEQRAGRSAKARALYERYLSQYPRGRFRDEAVRGLAATSRK